MIIRKETFKLRLSREEREALDRAALDRGTSAAALLREGMRTLLAAYFEPIKARNVG